MEETDTAGVPWKSTSPLYLCLCPREVNSPSLSHNPATMPVPHHRNTQHRDHTAGGLRAETVVQESIPPFYSSICHSAKKTE